MQVLRSIAGAVLMACALLACSSAAGQDRALNKTDRARLHEMLDTVESDIEHHYYDPAFHGVDVRAVFQEARSRIEEAPTLNRGYSAIAAGVMQLNDSHTTFLLPAREEVYDYGFEMSFIGGSGAFVTAVRPGSDAEKQGLRPGHRVVAIEGFTVTGDVFWKLRYVFETLRPQPTLRVSVISPEGNERTASVNASVYPAKLAQFSQSPIPGTSAGPVQNLPGPRYFEHEGKLLICKLRTFALPAEEVSRILKKIHSYKFVIFDLRGNPGGYEEALLKLVAGISNHPVKVAERRGRKHLKALMAQPEGRSFSGAVAVLVDSGSGSASELLARVVQLEHRGTVIGDRTSGRVMQSTPHIHQIGINSSIFYGVTVTDADLIMSDGQSLENAGVIPDVMLTPTAEDLAAGRDPVLAHAVHLDGMEMTPEEAGALFPVIWTRK